MYCQRGEPSNAINENEKNNIVTCNTIVVTPKKKQSAQQIANILQYALTDGDIQQLIKNQLADAGEVWKLFNTNCGCQHQRIQLYLAHGEFADHLVSKDVLCAACPVCTGKWDHYFLPVRKDVVKQWLQAAMLDSSFSVKSTAANLLAFLWGK